MIAGAKFVALVTTLIAIPAFADASAAAPDPSGIWARNSFNFESPPSGRSPIRNLRRVGPDAGRFILGGDPVPLVGDYTNPILKPQAAEAVKRSGEFSASGHDIPDPSNQCADFSPPFMLQMQQRMEILQRKNEIIFVYSGDDQVRHVRLNEPHPKKVVSSLMGHSIAHYEGDALVVDTVGIELHPYTRVDRFGRVGASMNFIADLKCRHYVEATLQWANRPPPQTTGAAIRGSAVAAVAVEQ